MRKKSLPVSTDDFKEIIEKDYYFVDKSLLIEEILETKSKVTLLPRPRRFGKSLNMSMLRYFFNIENADENKKLFNGLKIEKTEYIEYQGKYPVIYMSFKDIKNETWEMCLEKMTMLLSNIFLDKDYLKDSLKDSERKIFDRIINREATKIELEESLSTISKYLYRYYGKKAVILIDEYDTPLTNAYTKGHYEKAIEFFRNFLSAGFKSNENLEFGVMTGIMRIAKESIFSGLNNPKVSTILDKGYQHFGLTETEVEEIVKYYQLDYEMEDVKRWYNGYKFGNTQMYNPWSIINFISNDELKAYWINSSTNDLIKEILIQRDMDMFLDLEKLFKGESVEKYLSEEIVFSNLKSLSNIWSLMFFSGYLTYDKKNISEFTGDVSYNLVIPNEEVKSFFRKTFIEEYSDGEPDVYLNMMIDLYRGKVDDFGAKFKVLYKNVMSYHDSGKDEKCYHHFMLGLVLVLNGKYRINSNRESGYGRYDIAMFPREKGHHGIIFEFKVANKDEKLKEKSLEALEQIKNKQYETDMRAEGIEKVIKIGVAFCGKDLEISWE